MIKRTEHGYALGQWEGIPTKLASGAKLTPGEVRAAVCRMNGLNSKEAGQEMHISYKAIQQYWASIYFKLRCKGDVVIAINRLIDLGALHRLSVVLLLVLVSASSIGTLDQVLRPKQSARQSVRLTRTRNDEMVEIGGAA